MPQIVYIFWIIILVVAVLVLPFIVWLLHKVLYSARHIERYLREMKEAGLGIAGNTEHITAPQQHHRSGNRYIRQCRKNKQ